MDRPVTQYLRLLSHNAGWYKAKVRKEDDNNLQLSYTEYSAEGSDALMTVIRQVVNQIREAPGDEMSAEECSRRLAKLLDDLNFYMAVQPNGDISVSAEFRCEPDTRYYLVEIFGQEANKE